MLRTGSERRCCGVGDPVTGGMCCFLGLYAADTFKPVLISSGLPVAGGMSGLSVPENRTAAIHFAYFPMVRCIRLPLGACNMGMFLTGMFSEPVIFPFVAHHTVAMVTACRNAVCFTAILAQTAEFADRTAFGAGLTALHTNICAVFAGVAAFTQGRAAGAIFLTILAQGRAVTATLAVNAQRGAVFTGAAIGAEHAAFTAEGAAAFADGHAIAAVFFAPTAQRYTVFTITAIQTQLGAVFTGAAIGADGAALFAGISAFRTNHNAFDTDKSAAAAEFHTVFTPSAVITGGRAVFAGAAIGADDAALTAGTAADGADLSAGCTVIAGLAETLRLLQTFLTSGAVLVLIEGASNAHFTFIAPFVRALTAASAAAGTGLKIHKAVAAFNAVTVVVFGTVDAQFAVCADITACTVGTQEAFLTVDGIIVYIAGAASLAGCTVF